MDNYKVLMVDDEPFILSSMQRLFRKERFQLLTAGSGEEALEIIRQQAVQVVVTDNIMPSMTGVELIKKVREVNPRTIRMIISGQSQMDAVLEAVNEGEAFRFILKPWNDIDLKATINIALAHYKLQEDNERLVRELQRKSDILDRIARQHPEVIDAYTYDDDDTDKLPTPTSAKGADHATRSF